jgi:Flp pilus assembly protein TadG
VHPQRVQRTLSIASRQGVRRGVAAVELAVLAPFLALVFVITVDFARVFYYQLTINDCARNGALFGSDLRSYTDATSLVVAGGATLNPPLTAEQVSVVKAKGSDGNPNVTVTVNYSFTTVTHFPGLRNTFNLKAATSMRVAP